MEEFNELGKWDSGELDFCQSWEIFASHKIISFFPTLII